MRRGLGGSKWLPNIMQILGILSELETSLLTVRAHHDSWWDQRQTQTFLWAYAHFHWDLPVMRCMPGVAAAAVGKGKQKGMETAGPGGIWAPKNLSLKLVHLSDILVMQTRIIPFYWKPVGTRFSVTCNQDSWICQVPLLYKRANGIQEIGFYFGKRKKSF